MSIIRLSESPEPGDNPPAGRAYLWLDSTSGKFTWKDEDGNVAPLDGNTVLSGTVDPTTEGVDGDFYIRTDIWEIFGPKAGTWGTGTSLIGADGAPGEDGYTILNGTVNPTTEGINGDFYIRTDTWQIFGPKTLGNWGSGTSLIGPQGAAGADGADGANGVDGTDGQGVPVGGTAGQVLSKIDSDDFNTAWVDPVSGFTGTADRVAGFDGAGEGISLDSWQVNSWQGRSLFQTPVPSDLGPGQDLELHNVYVQPSEDSPNESYNLHRQQFAYESPFNYDMGITGRIVTFHSRNFTHNQGGGDIGEVVFQDANLSVGDGVSSFDMRGFSYAYGFGQIQAGVNITGPIQGYGFQPNLASGVTLDTGAYIASFYDSIQIADDLTAYYTSFGVNPSIGGIANGYSMTGLSINPTIGDFQGNAGFQGISITGNYGTMETGSWNGINVNPQSIDSANYAVGVYANVDNVALNPGTQSSVVIQDLTVAFVAPGDNDGYTLTFADTATAGSETVGVAGQDITVGIESGVSTATQVKAALDTIVQLTTTISGTASNPQVTEGPLSFSGGSWPGTKYAADFVGDVRIDGSLQFTGALSIGALNAFETAPIVNGGGNPTSVHSLISGLTAADSVTVANADMIGINTASLMQIGEDAALTSGPLGLGLAALVLPAVLTMADNSSVEHVHGSVFAVNLDVTAAGGTVTNLHGCRSVFIPNGVTAVTNSRGYVYDAPFGAVSSNAWGIWINADVENWFSRSVKIGGTAGSTDQRQNSSVALEVEGGAILFPSLTTTERDALTALNGMQIYNETTGKMQAYAGGSWVDLH